MCDRWRLSGHSGLSDDTVGPFAAVFFVATPPPLSSARWLKCTRPSLISQQTKPCRFHLSWSRPTPPSPWTPPPGYLSDGNHFPAPLLPQDVMGDEWQRFLLHHIAGVLIGLQWMH